MVATYYQPGHARLADGSRATYRTEFCAMRHVPLGSEVLVTWHGKRFKLIVRDRCRSSDVIDLPSREFADRFGRAGINAGRVHVDVKVLGRR